MPVKVSAADLHPDTDKKRRYFLTCICVNNVVSEMAKKHFKKMIVVFFFLGCLILAKIANAIATDLHEGMCTPGASSYRLIQPIFSIVA